MGVDVLDTAALSADGSAQVRPFAGWPVWAARCVLVVLIVLLVAAAIVPVAFPASHRAATALAPAPGASPPHDQDIALYDTAIRRVAAGENYYDFIVAEQRARDYPVRPGITVRLPTLAYLEAGLDIALGRAGRPLAAVALVLAIVVCWWRRLGLLAADRGRQRTYAVVLAFAGAAIGLNWHYSALHEIWAGGLILLSFGLRRDGRWLAALLVAALALAIRELALPHVLLMAAFALAGRNWREGTAWTTLAVLFAAGLAWHLALVDARVLPTDPPSPSWLALRGMTGWLSNVVQSSNLRFLPHVLAGPLVVLMTFGWLGWRDRRGARFGFLLGAGYGAAFVIAGRWNNFYWGAIVAPVLFPGLAFAPRALGGLVRAARLPSLRSVN